MGDLFDVTFSLHRLAAGAWAAGGIGGIGLVLFGLWTTGTAFRASRAFESSCDDVPPAAPTGVWIRLRNCAVDENFYDLTGGKGLWVREVWRNPESRRPAPPSQMVLAVPLPSAMASRTLRSSPGGLTPLPETMGVIIGRVGTPPYTISTRPDSFSVATGAVIIDVITPPTFLEAAMLLAPGLLLLAGCWWLHTHGGDRLGRVLPLTLLGIVILFRVLVWIDDPMHERTPATSTPPPAPLAPPPPRDLSLEALLARVPHDGASFEGTLPAELSDTLDALITHMDQAPGQIRDALMPAIYSSNETTRRKVLAAFRSKHWLDLSTPLLAEATGKGPRQRQAFEAALALGLWRTSPNLMIVSSRNPTTSALVQQELRLHTDADSARLLALIWVDGADAEFGRLARERETSSHDISAALVEIVLDPRHPETRRTQAAYRLGTMGEVGALPPLRRYAVPPVLGALKQSVDDTIDKLEVLHRQGRAPQMRALTN
jgi:hypothetical protein